ncbi:response regulator [Cognatishimia sp. F0-27]|uniref:response regulator n=1 Tax=Cognatishimia sp. F0-27 TaxID=2816855 RepID=UPI001D0C0861|nr:response regulator [Cognatishimia sp. F0-27]MCC1494018.1 response regulator [Cognatishimia sp. F0-27]
MQIELLQNAALLSITLPCLVWVFRSRNNEYGLEASVKIGLICAVVAFLVSATPIHLDDGATVDARAGPVLIAGILGGPVSGILAAIGGATARYVVGGNFAFSGVVVYFLYALAGSVLWLRWFVDLFGPHLGWVRTTIGAALSLGAAALMFFLIQPEALAQTWLAEDYPWIALANVVSVFLTAGLARVGLDYTAQSRELQQAFATIDLAKQAGGIGIWTFDPMSGEAVWDNTNKTLHGLEIDGNRGSFQDWERSVHPDDLERTKSEFDDALNGRKPFDTEYRVVHPDGKTLSLKANALIERTPGGDVRRVVGTNFDLTPLMEKEAELTKTRSIATQAQKLDVVGKLTGGVAHDFNNLLAIIQGNLELLLEDEESRQFEKIERLDILTSAIAATRRGAELTRSMLAFARKSPLEPRPTDLNAIVRETEKWISRTLPASIEIEVSLQHRLWCLSLDVASLQSALVNVIVNARDAMPRGGKLTIETSNVRIDAAYARELEESVAPGRYVLVAISDTGTGIAPDLLPNVMDPFVSSKDMSVGSGLGLSMVEGFARQSGGFVKIYSEVGVGTSVKIFFPATDSERPPERPPETQSEHSEQNSSQILVAEDQIEVLALVVRALESAGYTVDAVSSGDDALTQFSKGHYDLLITDIVMPGKLNGPALAKACRDIQENLPVIFMSGYASEAAVHGNGLKPSDVRLMKPVPKSELLQAVKSCLDAKSSP